MESFIGLEIHIHLATETKLFCGCRARFGDEPNTNVCPVCLGYPGTLPVANQQALFLGYVVARALNCELSPRTVFERKNYFYPDLPKNYQISQYEHPIGRNGFIMVPLPGGEVRKVRIHDAHLEEDAGKMIHAGDMSLIDYNRAGYPLMEIVTEPDLKTGEEAEAFLIHFQRVIRYLKVSDGNMEEGSMRCDANVSVNFPGKGLGTKVEIKNLNSSRFVKKALNFEIQRQIGVLKQGGTIRQETRLWNENRDLTEVMRTKEMANDYRYFPEPDMPPFEPDPVFLEKVEKAQTELPDRKKARFVNDYRISEESAEFLIASRYVADYFEEVVQIGIEPALVASWLSGDVQKLLNRHGLTLDSSPMSARRLGQLLRLLNEERIHGKIAKKLAELVFEEDRDPEIIMREKGLEQIVDFDVLRGFIKNVADEYPAVIHSIKNGDERQRGFLIGKIMEKSQGRAHPQKLQKLFDDFLSEVTA